jgi:hypothetical protein
VFAARPDDWAVPALLVPGAAGSLAALPVPLGSLPELFRPAAFAGPGGTPWMEVGPAPADPALGVPTALLLPVVEPLAAPPALVLPALPLPPPALCANEMPGTVRMVSAIIAANAVGLVIENSFPGSTTAKPACSGRNDFGRGPLCNHIRHVAGAEAACVN